MSHRQTGARTAGPPPPHRQDRAGLAALVVGLLIGETAGLAAALGLRLAGAGVASCITVFLLAVLAGLAGAALLNLLRRRLAAPLLTRNETG